MVRHALASGQSIGMLQLSVSIGMAFRQRVDFSGDVTRGLVPGD